MDLINDLAISVVGTKVDLDNNALTSSAVDTQGYEGVIFIGAVSSGEVGTSTIKAQQSSDDASADAYADLEDTSTDIVTGASTNGIGILDVRQPRERYLKAVLTGANFNSAKSATILAIKYGKGYKPVTTSGFTQVVGPAEGTA